jgi:alanine dehydrogenase
MKMTSKMNFISLDGETIDEQLTMEECLGAMEDLFLNEGSSIAKQPMRTLLRVDPDSIIFTMPSHSPRLKRFAVKIVTEYKRNPERRSMPVQGGIIVLMDAEDSRVLATLDSSRITAIRTGAVSGLATKYLSRADSEVVAVVGSGQQARTMLEAVSRVRRIKSALVHSRNLDNARRFASEMSVKLGIQVEPFSKKEDALKKADIINVATNSSIPVLNWSEVPVGAHLNSIGTLPERRELDRDAVCNSSIFVDTMEGVLKEAGDVIDAISSRALKKEAIRGDLSQLVKKEIVGRKDDSEVTLFKSVGFALQDVYASSFVYNKVTRA